MTPSTGRRSRAAFRVLTAFSATLAGVAVAPSHAASQEPEQPTAGATQIDSVVVEGSRRVQDGAITAVFGVQPGQAITYRDIQRGIKALMGTGQFRDVVVRARGGTGGRPVTLVVEVEDQEVIRTVRMPGLESISQGEVRDTAGLRPGQPLRRQSIIDAKEFIRSELVDKGIPFARIEDRVEPIPGGPGEVSVVLEVEEGHRVTVADLRFAGNEQVSDEELRGAMSVKPEGFWWFRPGSYDEFELRADLEERLPQLYRSRGFIDFRIVSDTLIVDPQTGKSRVEVTLDEGPQYRLGSFEIEGNSRFASDDLRRYFREETGGLLRALGIGGSRDTNVAGEVFDAVSFEESMARVAEAYRNEGYLYVQINPVLQRNPAGDGGTPTVDATWQVIEGQPAIVNRVAIEGNDYTHEWVIRNQISVLPGDVYSQERLIRSYQSVTSLGFFEDPLPFPEIEPLDNGDVDITFNVTEKQTGSVNFGTSVGGGTGLSGFIGYEQPNLFGRAKSGSVRWDFGQFVNSFDLTYSDPAIMQSPYSGSASFFARRDQFFQFNTGQRRQVGTSLRFGFPWPDSRVTRIFLGYSISRTTLELFSSQNDASLFGRPPGVQSQVSVGVTRQTTDHPLFPTVGSRQNVNVEFNGGILGGDGNFRRVLADAQWWVPTGRIGGDALNPASGVRFSLGLTLRSGAVFGDSDAFPFDRFWMGGVQFGQRLRGYDETSITPLGFFPEDAPGIQDIQRLGNAFFSMTAEYAVRLSGNVGLSTFFDAGNVYADPEDFDATRMFRGAGFGLQLVTPFGPLGLDYAYGFDKPEPGWQFHFRMGPGAGGGGF